MYKFATKLLFYRKAIARILLCANARESIMIFFTAVFFEY